MAHFDDAVRAVDLKLSEDDAKTLESAYKPHKITGALSEESGDKNFDRITAKK